MLIETLQTCSFTFEFVNISDTNLTWNNYKIPKAEEQSESSAMAWKGTNQAPATPLADSYYNYPYDPNAAGAYYHNQQSGIHYGNQTG